MNVLIVENEIYLARSIASRLSELGYDCHLVSSIQEALSDKKYDAVLLSTNISGQNFYPVLEKHKDSIIILMISYISNDTVSKPIKAGANDYIQKPFMIEELIRKLEHLREFNEIKNTNIMYKNYLDYTFNDTKEVQIDKKIKFPLLIKTNSKLSADAFVFKLSFALKETFEVYSLSRLDNIKKILSFPDNKLIYLTNFQNIKKNDKNKILNYIEDKRIILVSTDPKEDEERINTITLKDEENVFNNQDILSIENYVKYVINNFQSSFPDTELSKKLGISRKSLWERRKKYGISKEK